MGIITAGSSGLEYQGKYDPYIVKVIKGIPGRAWDRKRRVWNLPVSASVLELLDIPQVKITYEARTAIRRKEESSALVHAVKQEELPEPLAVMPVTVKPFAHQVKGFNIAMTLFGWGNEGEGE